MYQGIDVFINVLKQECEELNRGYIKWQNSKTPWVIVKVAQSMDGFIGKDSESQTTITEEEALCHSHVLRSKVDAILIGRRTAIIDNPSLTVRDVSGENPKRVILDTNRTLPLSLNIFQDRKAETIVLCSENRFSKSQTHFCKYLPVKEVNDRLSPIHILKVLAEEGITSVLIPSSLSSEISLDVALP